MFLSVSLAISLSAKHICLSVKIDLPRTGFFYTKTNLLTALDVFEHCLAQANPGGPCVPGNRLDKESVCLRHISDLLYDENHFFFGKDLDRTCDAAARNNSDDINCFVNDGNTRRYSLAARLFQNNLRAESIDRFLTVTFTTSPGINIIISKKSLTCLLV